MDTQGVEAQALLSSTQRMGPGTAVLSALGSSSPGLPVSLRATALADLPLRFQFDAAVEHWKQDVRYTSSLTKIVLHPAYQAIIGMGKAAVPMILAELQRNGGHWLWALHAITREDPAREGDGYEAAAHAWLRWGKEHGHL